MVAPADALSVADRPPMTDPVASALHFRDEAAAFTFVEVRV